MPRRCCEFVDSRLRRSPPDRASAVSYGQAGENAMRFPHLAHRSAAAHKLHSTTATTRYEFDSGKGETFSRHTSLSLFSPEAVQTTGTVADFLSDPLPTPDPSQAWKGAAAWQHIGNFGVKWQARSDPDHPRDRRLAPVDYDSSIYPI